VLSITGSAVNFAVGVASLQTLPILVWGHGGGVWADESQSGLCHRFTDVSQYLETKRFAKLLQQQLAKKTSFLNDSLIVSTLEGPMWL